MSADDFPADTTTTGSLANGGTIRGNIETAGDIDWFRLVLDADKAYRFTATTTAGTEPGIYVLDAADPLWPKYTNVQGLLSSDDLVNPFAGALPGHQYYLRVENPTPTAYTIGMTAMADDYGNSSASARTLAQGAPLTASFDYAGDVEHYRIAATAGMTYRVTVVADAMQSDGAIRIANDTINNYGGPTGYVNGPQGARGVSMTFVAKETRVYDVTVSMPAYSPPAGAVNYKVSTTAFDGSGPVVQSSSGLVDGKFTLVFDEQVKLGTGSFSVNGQALAASAIAVAGNTVTLDVGHNVIPGTYTVSFGQGALTDLLGNQQESGYTNVSAQLLLHGTLTQYIPSYSSGKSVKGTAAADDVVLYEGTAADYKVAPINGSISVTHKDGSSDILSGVERLYFTGSDDVVGLSLAGNLGQVYRLYQAGLGRTPDKGGLGYWLSVSDNGGALSQIAQEFLHSPEFATNYGINLSDAAFVDALYRNVLHRAGEAAGQKYWIDVLATGADRANVLVNFSESPENQAGTAALVANGFTYTPFG